MMQVIAIANQKGGVGKTTTAVNLAACLARAGQNTLLVDLDAQGNASAHVGVDLTEDKRSSYTLLVDKTADPATCIFPVFPNLSIIPAPASRALAEVDLALVSAIERERRLERALKRLPTQPDFVVLDTPPHLGMATLNAFLAADLVIIVCQTNFFGAEALGRLLLVLVDVADIRATRQRIRVLATMHRANVRANRQILQELQERFPDELFKTVIRYTTTLHEAAGAAQPITEYGNGCHGHKDYLAVMEEFLNEQTATTGIRSRA
ncbi:MAG: ParA family protein [Blastocatellia bacterium]|nr:ParA family protein [Blastocatellia bacterium]